MTLFQQNARNLMWRRQVLWKSVIKVLTRGLHRGSIRKESTSNLVQDVDMFLSFSSPVIHPGGTGATCWAHALLLSHTPTSKFICLIARRSRPLAPCWWLDTGHDISLHEAVWNCVSETSENMQHTLSESRGRKTEAYDQHCGAL